MDTDVEEIKGVIKECFYYIDEFFIQGKKLEKVDKSYLDLPRITYEENETFQSKHAEYINETEKIKSNLKAIFSQLMLNLSYLFNFSIFKEYGKIFIKHSFKRTQFLRKPEVNNLKKFVDFFRDAIVHPEYSKKGPSPRARINSSHKQITNYGPFIPNLDHSDYFYKSGEGKIYLKKDIDKILKDLQYILMLSNRIQAVQPSTTLAINAKVIELIKNGADILKFGTGEPDWDTPQNIKDAAKRAIDEGFTKYTDATGIKELKEAVVHKLKRDNGIESAIQNVLITNGGKQALFNLFMSVVNPGDEVIIPSPYWLSYSDMVTLCEGKNVFVDTCSNHFKLTAEMVKPAITSKTKLLILNSPSNPTGMVIEREEIEKIAELALKHNFYLISDEVYEYFLYDGRKNFSVGSLAELKDRVFTVNAVSKTYSMTGWRIGYVAGPHEIIKKMGDMQSHTTSNPCSIAQKAALEALTGDQSSIAQMAEEFRKRRDVVHEKMNQLSGFKLAQPEGAFYAFPDISDCFNDQIKNSFDFTTLLLEKAGVAVIPGGAFGQAGDHCIRFSYASSMKDIEEGLERVRRCL